MVRRWCLLWTVVLLQGCSAIKLGYNQLPTLGHWWLDSQLSLEDAQSEPVRQALLKLQRWHRDQELLLYADLLSKLQGMGTRDLEAPQVCEVWTQIDDGASRLLDQAIRLAAPITLELKPRQLRHLARHWEKKNEDWENDWLSGNAQERIERRLERSVSRFSDFYGSLSPPQTELLRSQLQRSVWTAEWGRQERLRRQQLVLRTLQRLQQSGTSAQQAEAALQSLWQQWLQPPSEADRQIYKRLLGQSCQNLAELHNSTSTEQRLRAVRRLRAYERDLRELASRS